MALVLHIPPCVQDPPHPLHPPSSNKALRIHIQGPLETVQKLLPEFSSHPTACFPQPGALELAELTQRALYGNDFNNHAPVLRDEYLGWVMDGRKPLDVMDYYGITFDHLVPPEDPDPEALLINIIEVDRDGVYADGGAYANKFLLFPVNPENYTGKKVLAVPRCCQRKKGTQDRQRINNEVAERESRNRASDLM